MKIGDIISIFLTFLNDVKIYHWQTKKYARHVASGDLYKKINDTIDTFVETMQSNGLRIKLKKTKITLKICNDNEIIKVLDNFATLRPKKLIKIKQTIMTG